MSHPTVSPYLAVRGTPDAVAFYEKVFGAVETGPTLTGPEGQVLHTEIRIGNSTIMLAEESEGFGNLGPLTIGGTPVRIDVVVDDADAVAARALEAGATIDHPVEDQFYGERTGRFTDPFGHVWILSQHIEDMSNEEMQRRCDEIFGG